MRLADRVSAKPAGAFWRRALAALAQAYHPARAADDADTVFQLCPARKRAEPRPDYEDPLRPPLSPQDALQ